jgi:hypothetical protein
MVTNISREWKSSGREEASFSTISALTIATGGRSVIDGLLSTEKGCGRLIVATPKPLSKQIERVVARSITAINEFAI